MKDRMRKALGFLGLIEDEYGEYTPTSSSRAVPDQPVYDDEVEWTRPAPQSARPFPTTAPANAPVRVSSNTAPRRAPSSAASMSLDANGSAPRLRAMPSGVRSVSPFSQDRDLVTIVPKDYNESGLVTDTLRSNRAVVLIVNHLDHDGARRVVDFVAGTAWALKATMETMEKGAVYLISPQGTHVSPDEKERLRATKYQSTGS